MSGIISVLLLILLMGCGVNGVRVSETDALQTVRSHQKKVTLLNSISPEPNLILVRQTSERVDRFVRGKIQNGVQSALAREPLGFDDDGESVPNRDDLPQSPYRRSLRSYSPKN